MIKYIIFAGLFITYLSSKADNVVYTYNATQYCFSKCVSGPIDTCTDPVEGLSTVIVTDNHLYLTNEVDTFEWEILNSFEYKTIEKVLVTKYIAIRGNSKAVISLTEQEMSIKFITQKIIFKYVEKTY